MQIYSTEALELNKKPIKTPKNDKENIPPNAPKKSRSKKNVDQTTPSKGSDVSTLVDVAAPSKKRKGKEPIQQEPETEEVVTKKVKTEKQLAAIELRKQKRIEAKAALEKSKLEEEDKLRQELAIQEAKLAKLEEKKAAQKEKRRLARLAKKSAQDDDDYYSSKKAQESQEDLADWAKRQEQEPLRKEYDQQVRLVKKTEKQYAQPKEKAQVVKEVEQVAEAKWADPVHRAQITNEMMDHRQKMRALIFPNRPLQL